MSDVMTLEPDISKLSDDTPLFTVGDYKKTLEEVNRLSSLMDETHAKLEKKRHLLSQMTAIMPALLDIGTTQGSVAYSALIVPNQPVNSDLTWTGEIFKVVNELNSTDLGTLKAHIRKGPLKERIKKTDGGFYGGIKRLVDRGDIIRSGDTLYSKSAYGDVDIEPVQQDIKQTVPDMILDILEGRENGLKGVRIVQELRKIGSDPHGNYVYSVLGRLRKKGNLIQDHESKAYRLKKYKNTSLGNRELI